MKIKRLLFIASLVILFICCLFTMNQQYDKLARYPHELTLEERELVLQTLSVDDINYLVAQKIEPQQFLPYIQCVDFILNHTLWYDTAFHTQEEDKNYIVSFINRYKERLEYRTLEDVLTNYSYNVLTRFFDEGDGYTPNAKLVVNPNDPYTILKANETLYTFEPKDLVSINDLPHVKGILPSNDITIHKDVSTPLRELLTAASEINTKQFGDMHIVAGYISFENQIALYQQKKEEGAISLLDNVPGRNEEQLGYTIRLNVNENKEANGEENKADTESDTRSDEEKEQTIWLKDNAYKYGFIVRYPKQKEDVTGRSYQPYILRYVGIDHAKQIHDHNLAMEEANLEES